MRMISRSKTPMMKEFKVTGRATFGGVGPGSYGEGEVNKDISVSAYCISRFTWFIKEIMQKLYTSISYSSSRFLTHKVLVTV